MVDDSLTGLSTGLPQGLGMVVIGFDNHGAGQKVTEAASVGNRIGLQRVQKVLQQLPCFLYPGNHIKALSGLLQAGCWLTRFFLARSSG